ncbi:histidine phosphatase family protein [Noviherbaspirillum saxi]|uniref:Phosphoglycerate mutase n=1 Tax=Noviherbaspirillum saxi TaxID=2320863 RepID=A0A3A3FS58_9BURK|nr:histidine phosphatase family protein [Noviherbaspirillum saxi]RJF98094.1 phosphoglycerate mutase [Noviherbaspirillum saxi]
MRLYLIRHGKPEVEPGVCYGSTDLRVSEPEHARVLASLLPALPHGLPVYCSPLQRCRALAVAIADANGSANAIVDPRLAEMDFGAWEMRPWQNISQAEVDAWAADVVHYRPGGGETVLEVATRVRDFHESLRAQSVQTAIVVCHAGSLRLLSQCPHYGSVAEVARHAAAVMHDIGYGTLSILDCQ